MKKLAKIALLFLLPAIGFAQNDMEKTTLLDNKMEILLPKALHKMTDEEFKIKYGNPGRKPTLVMTDKNLFVNVVIDHYAKYPLAATEIEEFKNARFDALQKAYPNSRVLENGMKEINGKKFGVIRIVTKAVDQEIFNYFLYTNLDDRLLTMNFNCAESVLATWEKPLNEMVASIKMVQ